MLIIEINKTAFIPCCLFDFSLSLMLCLPAFNSKTDLADIAYSMSGISPPILLLPLILVQTASLSHWGLGQTL